MEQTANNQESPRNLNLWQRLSGVVFSPAETFKAVAAQPTLLTPVLVFLVINLGLAMIILPRVKAFTVNMMQNMPQGAGEQTAMTAKMAATGATVGTIAGAVVSPLLIWLVITLIFIIYSQFAGKEGTFKQIFAVVILAWVPVLLGGGLKTFLTMMTPPENLMAVQTSAALLLPQAQTGRLFLFLSKIDLFTIWNLVLISIGTGAVYKTSAKKTGALIFVLWLLYVGVSVVLFGNKVPGGLRG